MIAFVQDVDTKEVLQTQMVNLGQIVGIAEQGENYLQIYPNPAKDFVNIQTVSNIKNVSIYNVNGQKVYNVVADAKHLNLNTSGFAKGVYFMNIKTANGKIILKKLVVE